MGSTLITDAGTSIVLAGGAQWKNIYWSSALQQHLERTLSFMEISWLISQSQ